MLTNNEILQRLKHILQFDELQMHAIFVSVGSEVTPQRLHGYLLPVGDKAFLDCGYAALGDFLDGLIHYKRGSTNQREKETVVRLDNNLILKKLRIAFELKEKDLFEIFHLVEIDITKSELSALFRNPEHKNYRSCPDSILVLFLEGLEAYLAA